MQTQKIAMFFTEFADEDSFGAINTQGNLRFVICEDINRRQLGIHNGKDNKTDTNTADKTCQADSETPTDKTAEFSGKRVVFLH